MERRPSHVLALARRRLGLAAALSLGSLVAAPGLAIGQEKAGARSDDQGARLDAGLALGVADRLGDAPNLPITERVGLAYGAGLYLAPSRWFAIGATFEHVDLGRERGDVGDAGVIEVERDLNTLWGALRAYPVRWPRIAPFLEVGAGLAWQSADASGIAFTGPFASEPVSFACEGSDSANLALRVAAGVDVPVDGGFHFVGTLGYDAYRLSSDALSGCAPGAGSVSSLGLRLGFMYGVSVGKYVR